MADLWRKCSSCKSDIPQGGIYYVCDVSTCRQKKTNYAFCSVECWDRHLPIERHRGDSASAIEKTAPRQSEENATTASGRRRVIISSPSSAPRPLGGTDQETLVVASKVKKYIHQRSNMNTSASTMEALSDRVRLICEEAIVRAREDGRKTVMDRDVP